MSGKKDNKEEDDPTKAVTLETQTGILSEEEIKKDEEKSEICRGLNKESTTESDPVLVLQLSQAMFVPESLEDDGSLIIPPTPEGDSVLLIIPSTPTEQQGADTDGIPDLKNKGEEKQKITEKCEKEEEKVVCFIPSMTSSANEKTEIPDSQEECRHSLESSDEKMCLAVSDSEDTTMMKASWDDEMPSKFEKFEGSDVDDWCLHLSASETTQSLQLTFDEVDDKKDPDGKDLPHEDCPTVVTEKDSDKNFSRPTFSLESQSRNPLAVVTESQPKLFQEIVSSKTRDISEKNSEFSNYTKSVLIKKVTIHSEAEPAGEVISSPRHGSADFFKKTSQVRDFTLLASSQSDVEMVSDFEQNSVFNKKENFSDAVEDDDTPDVVAIEHKVSDGELQFESTLSETPLINSDVQKITCCTPSKKQKSKELTDVNDSMVVTESSSLDVHNNDRSNKETQTSIEEMNTASNFRTYLGSFSDPASLSTLLFAAGGKYSSKDVDSIMHLSTLSDEREFIYSRSTIIKKFILKDNRVYQSVEMHEDYPRLQDSPDVVISPETSTSITSKKSSQRNSVTSGELADISSSISSSGFHHDSIPLSSQTFSSLDGSSEASILSVKGIGSCRPVLSNIPSLKLRVSSARTEVRGSENSKVGENQLDKDATKLSNLEEMTRQAKLEAEIFNKLPKCVPGRKKNTDQCVLPNDKCLPPIVAAKDIASSAEDTSKTNLVPSNERNLDFYVNTKGYKRRLSRNGKRSSRKKKKQNVVYNEELRCGGIPSIKFSPKSPTEVSQKVDSPTPGHTILPGVRVMARWRDGFYYPGIVVSQEMEGRWVTKFDDGATRIVPEENLFKITSLQVGTSVLVRSSDDYYDPGIVSGHYREADEIGYIVELDSGPSKRFPRACVILSTDQANIILGYKLSIASPSSAVSLDNIVDGKRKRTPVICPTTSPLRTSLKRKAKNPDSNLDNTESSANEAVSATKAVYTEMGDEAKLQDKLLLPCESQSPLVSNQNKKISRRPLTLRKVGRQVLQAQFQSSTSSDGTSDDLKIARPIAKSSVLEPVTTGKNIFQGHAFLLSQSDKKLDAKGKMPDFERESDFEDRIMQDKGYGVQFDKEYLCNQIELEGGIVFDSFEESQKSVKTKKVFLIASFYLRTIKYIQCLASNTPCVEHKWIVDCCHTKEVLDYHRYLLPAGFGLIEQQVIEWHGKRDALKGLKIVLLCPKKPSFVEAWTPVLLAAKADLVQKWNLPTFTSHGSTFIVDFIVTDSSCPNKVVAAARRRHIPVVSTEWVIQCLITGVRLPHDSHPKFQYNFIE